MYEALMCVLREGVRESVWYASALNLLAILSNYRCSLVLTYTHTHTYTHIHTHTHLYTYTYTHT